LAALAPFILTRDFGLTSFMGTGQIGDTIGGLTAPFLSLLGALLIYLSFKEQIEANDITRRQFSNISIEENNRKERIKKLVLWDLEFRIKTEAVRIKTEVKQYIPIVASSANMPFVDYVDFNNDIFKANSLNDYFEIFDKEVQDLNQLCNFYNRVDFIYKNIPLFSSKKLSQDRIDVNSWAWRPGDQQKKQDFFNKLPEKYIKTSQSLIHNIDNLISQIDAFVEKYK
jgi:hypothetical protein